MAGIQNHTVRSIVALTGLLVFGLAASRPATAQEFPNREIVLVCAFPAGSGADIVVRFFAEKLRPLTGRTIIVQNRPGAGGNMATEFMLRAKPDGHTIFVHAGNTVASNQHLIRNNPIDALKQVQIAATINRQGFFMTVHANSPHRDLKSLTEAMRAKGDKASYAVSANSGIIMGALYKQMAGLKSVEVRYKRGIEAIKEMESGVIDYALHDPQVAMQEATKGTIRLLAAATGERLKSVPDVPSMAELGYPMDLQGWFAAMVPAETPRASVTIINGWFNKVLATPEAKDFLNKFGGEPWISTPEEGQARLIKDVRDWGPYVQAAGLKPL
jgi:tripartite-type tricarboxylate transporter receptor subunit TctC